MSERVLDELRLPLDGKVVLVLDVELFPAEYVWLELGIWSTSHPCEALIPAALVDGEDKENGVVLLATALIRLVPCVVEPLSRSKRG